MNSGDCEIPKFPPRAATGHVQAGKKKLRMPSFTHGGKMLIL